MLLLLKVIVLVLILKDFELKENSLYLQIYSIHITYIIIGLDYDG